MVKGKNSVILFILCILILLGVYASSKINLDNFNPSPMNFEKEDNFNISKETIELKIKDNQKNLGLVGIDKSHNKLYIEFNDFKKNTYAIRNLNTNEDLILYENKDVFATASSGVYNDTMYIVETFIEDDKLVSYVVLVDNQKNIHRYKIGIMNKIPYVQQVDNLLIIIYESEEKNTVNSYLSYFDMDTHEIDNITKEKYLMNQSGTVTGNYILFAGGIEDSIYYQVVEYNDEDIERDGIAYLYRIDKENKNKPKKIKTLDEKLIFISGDENSIITSNYIYEAPFYDSGKLHLKNNKNWSEITIPKITAGADIIGAEKINDNILLIYNNEFYYLYDYDNQKYTMQLYKKEDSVASKIKIFEDGFLVLEKTNNKYFLNIYNYINN